MAIKSINAKFESWEEIATKCNRFGVPFEIIGFDPNLPRHSAFLHAATKSGFFTVSIEPGKATFIPKIPDAKP